MTKHELPSVLNPVHSLTRAQFRLSRFLVFSFLFHTRRDETAPKSFGDWMLDACSKRCRSWDPGSLNCRVRTSDCGLAGCRLRVGSRQDHEQERWIRASSFPSPFHASLLGLRFMQCVGSRYRSLHPNHWSLASPRLVPATSLLPGRGPGPRLPARVRCQTADSRVTQLLVVLFEDPICGSFGTEYADQCRWVGPSVDRPQAMSKEDDEQLMESFSSAMLPP